MRNKKVEEFEDNGRSGFCGIADKMRPQTVQG
jgi:hypothetical protein